MASFGHIAIGLAAARAYTPRSAPRWTLANTMIGFSVAALAPDLDVVAFVLRIPYDAPFGHRGATHSLAFALACGLVTEHRDGTLGRERDLARLFVHRGGAWNGTPRSHTRSPARQNEKRPHDAAASRGPISSPA